MQNTEFMIANTPIKYRGKRIEAGERFPAQVEDMDVLLDQSLANFADVTDIENNTQAPPDSDHLIDVIGAIATLDPDDSSLWTQDGKPKIEAIEAVPGIDFDVSARLRDAALNVIHQDKQ